MGRDSPPINLSPTTVASTLGALPGELEGTIPPFVMTGRVTSYEAGRLPARP